MNTRLGVSVNGGEKTRRINLGLAVLRTRVRPGAKVNLDVIAAYCDCTRQGAWVMEQMALAKLRRRLKGQVRQELEAR